MSSKSGRAAGEWGQIALKRRTATTAVSPPPSPPKSIPLRSASPPPDLPPGPRPATGFRDRVLDQMFKHLVVVDTAMLALGIAIAPLAGAFHLSIGPVLAGRGSGAGIAWGSVFVVFTLFAMRFRRLYDLRLQMHPVEDVSRIISATSVGAILLVGLRVLANNVNGAANQAFRLWAGSTICLAVGRVAMAAVVRRRQREGSYQFPTLILGCEGVGAQIAHRLAARPELGMRPIGFVDEPHPVAADLPFPLLGTIEDIVDVVKAHTVEHVIVAFSATPYDRIIAAMRTCRRMGVSVSTVPRLHEEVVGRTDIEYLGGIPLLRSRPSDPLSWQFSIKYALDRMVAAVLLVILSPLLILIALLVAATSRGPVFYRQRRMSLDGREFEMLKFRTMRGHEDEHGHWDAAWAARAAGRADSATIDESVTRDEVSDDRRTQVGKVLRKASLDELPQLINVLRGDMSLVGPRPERTVYAQSFLQRVYRYGDRLRVKPGLTGWAQVHGLRGQTSLADRVEWDNYYIENWNLLLDLKILLLTLPAMFRLNDG